VVLGLTARPHLAGHGQRGVVAPVGDVGPGPQLAVVARGEDEGLGLDRQGAHGPRHAGGHVGQRVAGRDPLHDVQEQAVGRLVRDDEGVAVDDAVGGAVPGPHLEAPVHAVGAGDPEGVGTTDVVDGDVLPGGEVVQHLLDVLGGDQLGDVAAPPGVGLEAGDLRRQRRRHRHLTHGVGEEDTYREGREDLLYAVGEHVAPSAPPAPM
jgi:hypothetical protein